MRLQAQLEANVSRDWTAEKAADLFSRPSLFGIQGVGLILSLEALPPVHISCRKYRQLALFELHFGISRPAASYDRLWTSGALDFLYLKVASFRNV